MDGKGAWHDERLCQAALMQHKIRRSLPATEMSWRPKRTLSDIWFSTIPEARIDRLTEKPPNRPLPTSWSSMIEAEVHLEKPSTCSDKRSHFSSYSKSDVYRDRLYALRGRSTFRNSCIDLCRRRNVNPAHKRMLPPAISNPSSNATPTK